MRVSRQRPLQSLVICVKQAWDSQCPFHLCVLNELRDCVDAAKRHALGYLGLCAIIYSLIGVGHFSHPVWSVSGVNLPAGCEKQHPVDRTACELLSPRAQTRRRISANAEIYRLSLVPTPTPGQSWRPLYYAECHMSGLLTIPWDFSNPNVFKDW